MMSLISGAKLGPYEILAPLGAGGMGEVYRARDTRLQRSVAIKVLPAEVSGDSKRRERFEREAKTISSLNHPHICVLHDIGSQDGVDYLVMECVEGETLAKRLEKGPLPLEQVLKYGAQIADALDKAHRAGIVHRDLKPGNIMLTPTGAKLLDFGLAKPTAALVGGVTMTAAAPASPVTQEGTVVGTFQYMSPEQVEGKEVDGRSDIFSLGAVLYEMVTGKRAFEGKSQLSVASAILEKEPDPITSTKPLTPAALNHAIRKCLEKFPDKRWQSASDLASELEWVGESGSSVAAPLWGRGQQRKRERLAWTAAGLGLATAIAFAGLYFWRPVARPYPIRSFIPAPDNTSFVFVGDAGAPPVLSPDGKNIAFLAAEAAGAPKIYVRSLSSLDARVLAGTDNAWAPFWSADGRKIGFFADGKLKVVDIQGGSPFSLADAANSRGGCWSRDGTIVFVPDFRASVYRVPAAGGTPVAVTRIDESKHTSHRWPHCLPDGKHFLYLAVNHEAPQHENDAIYYASLDGKENIRLKAAFTNPEYAAGRLLYVRGGDLVAQVFDASTGKLAEEEQQVASGVTDDGTTWRAAFTVSLNGLLAYASGRHQSQLGWYDRTGKQLGAVGEKFGDLQTGFGGERALNLSPGGDRVALAIQGSTSDIWVMDVSRGNSTRLTFGPTGNNAPVWSPDGKWVAYWTVTKHGTAIARRLAVGGAEETLLAAANRVSPQDWSPDGKYLLYVKGAPGTYIEIWALPMFGERKPFQVVPSGNHRSYLARFSPDGQLIAYQSDETGRAEVYIMPFRGSGKWQISTTGGSNPLWRSDGKEIFYLSPNGSLMAVPVGVEDRHLKFGSPQLLFHSNTTNYDVARGGEKFLLDAVSDQGSKAITLVTNWPAEFKQ